MSLFNEQAAFLLDVCKLVEHATKLGYTVSGRELGRTAEQQQIYVRTGKSKTMNSNHLRNCAIDLYFQKGGKLELSYDGLLPLAKFWASLHPKNQWGGFWWNPVTREGWKDLPHFERRP